MTQAHGTETADGGAGTRSRLLTITAGYVKADNSHSLAQLLTTLLLWCATMAGGLVACRHSAWGGAGMAVVAAAFLVRLFMIQHDCGHRSFFTSHAANDLLGFWLGVVTMTPYRCWKRFHAQHHGHSGNLDHRGFGEINTLTTREYEALGRGAKVLYRIYRHPLLLIVIGPPLLFILRQRTTYKVPAAWRAERRSVHQTNLGILAFLAGLSTIAGPREAVGFYLLTMSLASIAGVWLFYVQHQFPAAYWKPGDEWVSWQASLEGASYYDLPAPLRWLTANIGVHHIHHLDARIPNYRLYECFRNHAEFSAPVRIGMRDGLRCLDLRLYDTETRSMVPFRRRSAATTKASAA